MKTIKNIAAQGDVLIMRVDTIPSNVTPVDREGGRLIVTHSETGHHHVIDRPKVSMYADPADQLIAWIEVHDDHDLVDVAELVHERPYDTHETLGLPVGRYQVRRQREYSPEGWRRVQD